MLRVGVKVGKQGLDLTTVVRLRMLESVVDR
jgi:hypothetical protein